MGLMHKTSELTASARVHASPSGPLCRACHSNEKALGIGRQNSSRTPLHHAAGEFHATSKGRPAKTVLPRAQCCVDLK